MGYRDQGNVMDIRLSIDIVARRLRAEETINRHFADEQAKNLHISFAHQRKRDIASSVLRGDAVPMEFAEEARLLNVNPEQLAEMVLNKPDEFMQRELKRRKIITALRMCESQRQIDDVLRALYVREGTTTGVDGMLHSLLKRTQQ